MHVFDYAHIFIQLLRAEFIIFKETFFDKLINSLIWVVTTVPIAGYVLPVFGLSQEFGAFFAIGVVVSCGWFEVWPQVANFIADLEGERHISYHLTLPIPGWLMLIKMVLVIMVNALIMGATGLVTAKLILWNRFSFANLSLIKLVCVLILIDIFFGFFSLFMASLVKNMHTLGNIFMRVMHPLCWLGGFQFSWQAIYLLAPGLGYALLLNPYIYAMEAMRAAIFGQNGYLPFWICMALLFGFILLSGWIGMRRLKKRLDFV